MYPVTRGDTKTYSMGLTLGGIPYCMISGSSYLMTVKANVTDPDSAAIVQKTLGQGLTEQFPSNMGVTFYPIDFYYQTQSCPFYFDIQAIEPGGNVETVCFNTIGLSLDVTRSTGVSVTIYTGNPPYPSGAPYPP